ncbi:MAG: ribonuclease [Actinomycetota bacterium]|jgi:ribonuclease HII|nr:ribonuclease [Actinomycetota bacterium]
MVAAAPGRLEARLDQVGFERVAGADEVGRGALAGPLIAAAVILPPGTHIEGLKDSKLCTRLQRERIAEEVHEVALAVSIVRVRPDRIDREGLHRCNLKALRKALNNLEVTPDFVLLDAFRMQRLSWPGLAVKKADVVSKNVAAASIVAKVHRDKIMRRYHRKYRGYGFDTNVGYGTSEHWAALKRLGPSEIHRRSFFGVIGFPDADGVIRPHLARDLKDQGSPDEALEEETV